MKKYLYNILPFILLMFLLSCSNQNKDENTISIDNIPHTRVDYWNIAELKNSPKIIGKISSFDLINDSSFVISTVTPPQVILFDFAGNQLQEIGQSGKGPYEYLKPSITKYYQDNIYVWCPDMLRLIVYKTNGTPIKQYNFDSAIKDFEIYENYACLYSSGGQSDSIVTIFDLSESKFKEQFFGYATKEHHVLNMKEYTGGIAIKDNLLYFTPTSYPEISVVDLSTLKLISHKKIGDPEFKIEKISSSINDFLMDQNNSIQYIFGSPVVTGIFPTDSIIVVRAEIGPLEMEGNIFKDVSKRMIKFYVFNRNMDLINIYSELAIDYKNKIYSVYNSNIYAVELTNNLDSYNLQKVNIKICE